MTILLSTALPIAMSPDDRVRNIDVQVVQALTHAFILGSGFFRANSTIISLDNWKGFQPSLGAPWVLFPDRNAIGTKSGALYDAMQTTLTSQPGPLVFPRSSPRCWRVPLVKRHGKMTVSYSWNCDWPNQQTFTVLLE